MKRLQKKISQALLMAVIDLSGAQFGYAADAPQAVERIVWEKTPIPITLTINEERLVSFPAAARVGMPADLQPIVRTQSAGGTVYWRAAEAFTAQRVQVQLLDTGEIVLIDLSAVKKNPAGRSFPIEIEIAGRSQSSGAPGAGNPDPSVGSSEIDYATLTRFAAQQLYAPNRLLASPNGIFRVAVPKGPVNLTRGLEVEAVAIAAWQGGNLHVTAVRLRNLSRKPIILDPRTQLRGAWLAATFQHVRLHSAGEESDTTAVYLISNRPFRESL